MREQDLHPGRAGSSSSLSSSSSSSMSLSRKVWAYQGKTGMTVLGSNSSTAEVGRAWAIGQQLASAMSHQGLGVMAA